MKKVLWSIAAAALAITLTGCANTAEPAPSEDRPSRPAAEITVQSTEPVAEEPVVLSAGDEQAVNNITISEDVENTEAAPKSEPQVTTPAAQTRQTPSASTPKEKPASSVQVSFTFEADSKKETVENPAPSVSAPAPAPSVESEASTETAPPVAAEPEKPAFSIDHWISYAREYAKSAGLNLDPAAVDCWDNPITAGAHCTYLERDIQNRLNRYAKDETILDVWVLAESRSDGSYNIYIGYE